MRSTGNRRVITHSFLRETGTVGLTDFLAQSDGGVKPELMPLCKKEYAMQKLTAGQSICGAMSHASGIYITPFPKARGPRQRRHGACKSQGLGRKAQGGNGALGGWQDPSW